MNIDQITAAQDACPGCAEVRSLLPTKKYAICPLCSTAFIYKPAFPESTFIALRASLIGTKMEGEYLKAVRQTRPAREPVEGQRVPLDEKRVQEIYEQARWAWAGKGDIKAFYLSFSKLLLDEIGIKPIRTEGGAS